VEDGLHQQALGVDQDVPLLTTARSSTVCLLPPGFAAGIIRPMIALKAVP
jgi:hypothetical protein